MRSFSSRIRPISPAWDTFGFYSSILPNIILAFALNNMSVFSTSNLPCTLHVHFSSIFSLGQFLLISIFPVVCANDTLYSANLLELYLFPQAHHQMSILLQTVLRNLLCQYACFRFFSYLHSVSYISHLLLTTMSTFSYVYMPYLSNYRETCRSLLRRHEQYR